MPVHVVSATSAFRSFSVGNMCRREFVLLLLVDRPALSPPIHLRMLQSSECRAENILLEGILTSGRLAQVAPFFLRTTGLIRKRHLRDVGPALVAATTLVTRPLGRSTARARHVSLQSPHV